MRISIVAIGVLIAGTVAASAMSDKYVSATWRYRMTVEVETPEGVRSGSAVHEISNSKSEILGTRWSEGGNPATFRGEAVVIDMGDDKPPLFAILPTDAYYMFYAAFPVDGPTTLEGIKYYKDLPVGQTSELPKKNWPAFVTFTDMSDPKSVTLVKGYQFNPETQSHDSVNRLEDLFGEETSVQSITLEITDEPVIWGVVDVYAPCELTELRKNWDALSYSEKQRINKLIRFKKGESQ